MDDLLVNTEHGKLGLSENNNTSNVDSFLMYDIEETINGIKRQLELLEIFVNNLSIESVNPDEFGYEECCNDCGDLWARV